MSLEDRSGCRKRFLQEQRQKPVEDTRKTITEPEKKKSTQHCPSIPERVIKLSATRCVESYCLVLVSFLLRTEKR